MNDTKTAAIDRGKKLIKYVCETANITQTQLAEAIGYSQQNLQNKMSRGTVPMPLIEQFMADRSIALPAWAETSGESVEELANQISTLQKENEDLTKRLERAEKMQDTLISLIDSKTK